MHTIQVQRDRIHISNLSLTRDLGTNGTVQQNGHNGVLSFTDDNDIDDTDEEDNSGIVHKFRTDTVFRGKLIRTFWLGFAFFFLGWSVGLMGPSFPDLRLILNADIETASWLFTAGAFGYLIGSFIGGVAFDRFNKRILMVFNLIGMALTNSLIPWCTSFWLMITVICLCGGFEGSLETGGNAAVVATWGSEGSAAMLAIHFAFSAGGIVSPFVLQPFLATEICDIGGGPIVPLLVSPTNSLPDNITALSSVERILSSDVDLLNNYSLQINESTEVHTHTICNTYGETRVHYAFLISGVMTAIAAIPLFILYLSSRNGDIIPEVQVSECEKPSRPKKLPTKQKYISLVLMCSIMFIYTSIEDNFNSFLMTFCISYLDWPKSYGTLASSLNWASFAIGRLTGIFIVRCVKTSTILYVYFLIMIVSLLGFLIASLTITAAFLLWAFIPLVGFSLSVILPSVFSWTEECILPVSGKISSLYLVTGSAGAMLSPLLFGYLMEEFNALWYVYLLIGLSSLILIIYTIARCTEIFCIRPLINVEWSNEVEVHVNRDLLIKENV